MAGIKKLWLAGALACAASAGAQTVPPEPSVADPAKWPRAASPDLIDPATERFVSELMARMSVEEKVGQMIQGDLSTLTPDDLRRYPLGSILVGGTTPPLSGDDRAPQADWVATARAYRAIAMLPRPGHQPIPLLFGTDSVHGNNNVLGATLFPHNIGLGAANDPELMRRIGEVTAVETAATGPDWAFAPAVTVPQDDRWGRTYEGYSEDPAIVARLAGPMVRGLQGDPGTNGRIQSGHIAATAKHFLGDGGTTDGVDTGNTRLSEGDLIATHAPGYPAAIDAGVMTVMSSFSSWNGQKMHGNKSLLTDVLKGQMGFAGFVVGDWNGHAQVPGCTKTDCAASFNAGLDMAMAPDSWKGLYETTLAHARDGSIPMARIDDAVRRILRVKVKLGLFDPARPVEGKAGVLGSAAHRAVARAAVSKSLVLLKNDGVLPIRSSARVLVAGPGADSMMMQTGGWTLSWQGDGNRNEHFPNGETILSGIRKAVAAGGGSVVHAADGAFTTKPDVAIVVFGEQPYAEGRGDVRTLEFEAGDEQALALLRRLRAAGIPTVSVFLSGRPLWVNPELNASNAFVAAWLPGSEGGGVADVIVGDATGKPRRDFAGKLSFSWPRTAAQFALNKGQPGYDPLFALGYGLSYAAPGRVPALSEASGVAARAATATMWFAKGVTPAPFAFVATSSNLSRRAVDGPQIQEGAQQVSWAGAAALRIAAPPIDLRGEAVAGRALRIQYRLDRAAAGRVAMTMEAGSTAGSVDVTNLFSGETGSWRTAHIPLRCFADQGVDLSRVGVPFALDATAPLTVSIAEVGVAAAPAGASCPK